jgi:aminoglycoside phosphotransferase (APT) family kinase protein
VTTGDDRALPGLDLDRLEPWFAREVGPAGRLTARHVAGGKSNLTYEVTDGARTWIVRRPPLGHVLATAHDMAREHRVMSALADTDVPVPRTYALCEDQDVLGAPFYVMERVLGRPYRTAEELADLGPERTRVVAERMTDVLATLHRIDPADVGLADFGRPEGFLTRQVRRWHQQMRASHSRDLPAAEELHARLAEAVPETDRAGIVHGDYRLDNLLVDDADEVRAVLDWEMATLGDPLTDVALLVVYQRLSSLAPGGLISDVASAPGYPSERELLDRYATTSGRPLDDLGFHLGLATYKLAAIVEGIHYRHVHGKTVGAGFERVGDLVDPLLEAGLTALEEHR